MKLDLGSFAFGSYVPVGGSPSWGTALGQGKGLKFTTPGWDNILAGMMYKTIPTGKVYMPVGKGGHVVNGYEDEGMQLAALFDQVYINEVRIPAPFVMVIYRDSSASWEGRRTLKYGDKIEYQLDDNTRIKNADFIAAAREALQLSDDADWIISDLYIEDQEVLHMFAGIVNPHEATTYPSTDARKAAWIEAIKHTLSESSVYKKYLAGEEICTSHAGARGTLQKIFYGAPGTGKSHSIKEQTIEAEKKGNVFRTTFHPDSDYATFVGCYKPSMESKERLYDKDELISKLSVIKSTGVTYPCHKFAAKYWESLKQMSRDDKKSIISACDFPETMVVEIDKGIVIGEELSHGVNQRQIVYRFVAQAFTNAYIRAWQTAEPVYLVIEEINRGNCAQIFGDLFQLLDRDIEGVSKYSIIPDADLGDYIREHLQTNDNIPEAIREGAEMKLPSNLYIWASMNTSDQSLFPIDSAFKRRWEWEYVPIENAEKNFKIQVNEHSYDWWKFLEAINKEVFELTHSEDKQLGYFFVNTPNGIIDAQTLVNKVYFYLWNDVFKDYDIEGQKAFKKSETEAIAFKDFFKDGRLNKELAEQVLVNLGLTAE